MAPDELTQNHVISNSDHNWLDWVCLYTYLFKSSHFIDCSGMCPFQFSSVQSLTYLTVCNPMDCSTPGFPVHFQVPELAQTCVGDAIQPSHPLSSPSPPAFNLSQHQGLFKWVSSSHQVAKVLEFQSICLFSDLYLKNEKKSWWGQSSQELKQRQYISKCNTYASSCCLVNKSDLFRPHGL